MPAIKGLSMPSLRLILSYVFDWIVIMQVIRRIRPHRVVG